MTVGELKRTLTKLCIPDDAIIVHITYEDAQLELTDIDFLPRGAWGAGYNECNAVVLNMESLARTRIPDPS